MITIALMAKEDDEARMIFDKMYQLYINFPSSKNLNLVSWAIPEDGPLRIPNIDTTYYDAGIILFHTRKNFKWPF